ncbi:hypothetical protein DAX99_04865 [Salmonella enterica subsp. enterica]|uniref:Uncharacterized protein n=1 Tax=Salmonella enterica I TaxID=59201 RepID=A0A3R0YGW6_SALET|nr:hypothetical protein [Salmonella enterica]EBW6040445.1 hypothetical protein [Salmonella enterica subsp. enterica serovar Oranienburg]PUO48647.1 hypothetical protein DAY10_03065 [Salmonella enterica subsp. enterica]MIP07295.1 hypothetical protein [Salmonella enterica subsp. enterica serovar Oranienburg]MLU98437.1 hypothetical protein [Salmonella enterica subsp. enterica serovar Oranienburg]
MQGLYNILSYSIGYQLWFYLYQPIMVTIYPHANFILELHWSASKSQFSGIGEIYVYPKFGLQYLYFQVP